MSVLPNLSASLLEEGLEMFLKTLNDGFQDSIEYVNSNFAHADVPFYFEDVFDWVLGVFAYEERLSFWPGEHEIKPRSYHRFPSLTAARTEALRRVADLEAQLARREAELEGRYETARHPPSSRSHATAQSASWSSPARNEALKHEVAGLMQKRDDADADDSTPTPADPSAQSPADTRVPHTAAWSSTSSLSSATSTLRAGLVTDSCGSPFLRDAMPPTDLTRQIAAVTEDPVGLRAEEQRLSQIQNEKPQQLDALPHSSSPLRLTFRHILLVEEECTRLRTELAASTAREAALRELLVPVPTPAPAVPTEMDLLDDHGDEEGMDMDLVTPLQPTVLLNPEDV
ncbi:hypothetical protein V8E53_003942 [Lactarius tabidus]